MHIVTYCEVLVTFFPDNLFVVRCVSSNFHRETENRHLCPPFCCRLGALCLVPFEMDLQFLGVAFTIHDETDIDPFMLQLMADDKFLSQCQLYNAIISIDKTKVARSSQVVVV